VKIKISTPDFSISRLCFFFFALQMAQQLQELVLSSSSALTALYSLTTGSNLLNFKAAAGRSGGAEEKPLTTFIPSKDGLGGVVLGCAGGKSAINVWGFQKVCFFVSTR
jgi:hypothetical protein